MDYREYATTMVWLSMGQFGTFTLSSIHQFIVYIYICIYLPGLMPYWHRRLVTSRRPIAVQVQPADFFSGRPVRLSDVRAF